LVEELDAVHKAGEGLDIVKIALLAGTLKDFNKGRERNWRVVIVLAAQGVAEPLQLPRPQSGGDKDGKRLESGLK